MISGDKPPIAFTMPDAKKADALAASRPPEVKTAADRDGASVVVSVSRPRGTMLLDNTTPFNADKVEMIRRQLSEGGFKIEATIVAERMINDQKALLG
ncbi:flagellar biosynthesis anti-sigma factor FlgM [Limnobacter parvus]|uniref:Flagellar biosynthesis anti-sigma factor FlgM n=1 Tax=Limnobacter parvus TaxID=2939690 RepID=A0ABT1XIU6_9BURK|nr:flagellar biosynthesis anti-sigma factor FlgM [Limnobacter parvus]MCR2746207.1 flagellar biosynthesis anti-sigma factor FlgM [Limnobacter parvus]